jgi:prepilin-type N-terminal cleavage/methylation domain-containing protein/prepilin-type processing-associated H-X9-DG protein
MKIKPNHFRPAHGFTLVELLVTITIIAVLAALAFTMGPKMMKKGEGAKSIANMRQIGSTMGLYLADNLGNLPTGRIDIQSPNGSWASGYHWHQALLAQIYPDTEISKFEDAKWWEVNKPFLKNPLMTAKTKPKAFTPYYPGYAINMQISYNLFPGKYDWTPGASGPQTQKINISMIPEPGRTPLVTSRSDWHYTAADLLKPEETKPFLIEGKLPVLYVDGHVESMTPNEYALPRPKGRDYNNVPPKQN